MGEPINASDLWGWSLGNHFSPNSLTRSKESEPQHYYFELKPSLLFNPPEQWGSGTSFPGNYLFGFQGTFMGGDEHNWGSRGVHLEGLGGVKQYLFTLDSIKPYVMGLAGIGGGADWLNFGLNKIPENQATFDLSVQLTAGLEIFINQDSSVSIGAGYSWRHGSGKEDYNDRGLLISAAFTQRFGTSSLPPVIDIPGKQLEGQIIRYVEERIEEKKEEWTPKIKEAVIREHTPIIAKKVETELRETLPKEIEPKVREILKPQIYAEAKAEFIMWLNKNFSDILIARKINLNDVFPPPKVEEEKPPPVQQKVVSGEVVILDPEGNPVTVEYTDDPGKYNEFPQSRVSFAYAKALEILTTFVEEAKPKQYGILSEELKEDLVRSVKVPLQEFVLFNRYSSKLSESPTLDHLAGVLKEWIRIYKIWTKHAAYKDEIKFEIELTGYANDTDVVERNDALALARAKAVERYLIKLGLTAKEINDHVKIINHNVEVDFNSDPQRTHQKDAGEALQIVQIELKTRIQSRPKESSEILED